MHYYPVSSQQRFIKLSNDPGSDETPVTVPTKDGVEVTIQGTFYLNTAFDNSEGGLKTMRDFDTQFSTRTFGPDDLHPYDGRAGFSAFLGANVFPSVRNNLRQVISGVSCYQLVSSCALVQNRSAQQQQDALDGATKIPAIELAVQDGLRTDLKDTLGEEYFRNIKFSLTSVTLRRRCRRQLRVRRQASHWSPRPMLSAAPRRSRRRPTWSASAATTPARPAPSRTSSRPSPRT